MAIRKSELLHGLELRLLTVVPQNRKMKRSRIVVPVKVTNRQEGVLEKSERMKVGNGLAGPEFVIRDAGHDFVADRGAPSRKS